MHDTAGITIKNNNIHNFTFTAIQCGQNVGNVADCMFSTFSHNYIYTETWVPFNHDAAGIYFDTHWVNPGELNPAFSNVFFHRHKALLRDVLYSRKLPYLQLHQRRKAMYLLGLCFLWSESGWRGLLQHSGWK